MHEPTKNTVFVDIRRCPKCKKDALEIIIKENKVIYSKCLVCDFKRK